MKPIVILKINVGDEHGGIIPVNIFYNDDSYFKGLTSELCSKYPALNDPSIREIIYAQIKSGVIYALK